MKISKRGISLIVLVITIIVMIILATAIILSISGSDVRGKAEEAVSSTDIATAKEIVALAKSEWELNYDELEDKYDDFKDYATKKLEKAGITNVQPSNQGAANIIYTDKNGDTAIIPEGFIVSSATGENIVENGLVIYKGKERVTDDNVAVAQETRDQFVWVPVDNMTDFVTRDGYSYGALQEFVSDGMVSEPYSESTLSNDPIGERKEWIEMKASVEANKGFYIGRYETGTSAARTSKSPVMNVLVQKNKDVYNCVQWGTSMTEVGTKGAVHLARKAYNTSSVKSTLCYSVQWDAVMNFMKDVENPYVKGKKYSEDGTGMGWYSDNSGDSIQKTGTDVDEKKSNMVKNIYDLAGNVFEWTMEAYSTNHRVVRDSSYNANSNAAPPSYRGHTSPGSAFDNGGFRLTLYIK